MRVPDWADAAWGHLMQTMMMRRARNIWLLAAFSMMLVCLYSYSTVTASEPYVKRSHSSTTGGESVVVVFANRNNKNDIDKKGQAIDNDSHNRSPLQADLGYTSSVSVSVREEVRVKEIPFVSEKQLDTSRYIFRRLDPPMSGPSDEDRIPEGIQRMIAGYEDMEDVPEPNPRVTKGKPESRPPAAVPKQGGRNVPDWVFSFFFSGDARDSDPLKQLETGNDLVYSDLMDIDEEQQAAVSGAGGQPGVKGESRGTAVPHAPSDTLSRTQKSKQTFQPSGSSVNIKDPGVTLKQPDLNDPDETFKDISDLDFPERTSTEFFHHIKNKDLTKALPARAHAPDKTKPGPVAPKSPVKAVRENNIFKKIFHSFLNSPLASPLSDVQEPDAVEVAVDDDDDENGDRNHSGGTKKTTNAPPNRVDFKVHAPKSELNLTLWKGVLKERKRLLRARCQDNAFRQTVQDSKALVDRRRNLLYCPVPKAASGFFHRLFYVFRHSDRSVKELPSPFNVSLSAALAEEFDTVGNLHRKGADDFLGGNIRFLVVRDPFSRLYAAYVDRLLVPDSGYWKLWGIPAVSKHRKYPSAKSLACGHDVTFAEFVKHVIHTLHETDDTVRPVNALCAPCDLHFSIIGHVETLVSDIEYILSLMKLSITNLSSQKFMLDVNDDIIWDSTSRAFQFYEELKSCISKYEMGKRLWRNLQIHGIISEELIFSFAPKKVDKMTASEFVKLVQEARKTLPDSENVRQQKFYALKTAYENVPAGDIMQLVNIYALDFEYFGYDRHPSFLS